MKDFLHKVRNMAGKGSWASPSTVLATPIENDSILWAPSPQILNKGSDYPCLVQLPTSGSTRNEICETHHEW